MKFKKLFATLMVVVCVLGMSQAAFAMYGWGDTMQDAITIFRPGGGSTNISIHLDDQNDNDWYLVDNRGGYGFNFGFVLTSPPGINYNMQIVMMDQNDVIYTIYNVHDNGPGGIDGLGTDLPANHKAYVRIMANGPNDHGAPYHLEFAKFN